MRLHFANLQLSPLALVRDFAIYLVIAHSWGWYLEHDPHQLVEAFLNAFPFTDTRLGYYLLVGVMASPIWFLPLFFAALLVRKGRILHLSLLTVIYWFWLCTMIVDWEVFPSEYIIYLFYFAISAAIAGLAAHGIHGGNPKFRSPKSD